MNISNTWIPRPHEGPLNSSFVGGFEFIQFLEGDGESNSLMYNVSPEFASYYNLPWHALEGQGDGLAKVLTRVPIQDMPKVGEQKDFLAQACLAANNKHVDWVSTARVSIAETNVLKFVRKIYRLTLRDDHFHLVMKHYDITGDFLREQTYQFCVEKSLAMQCIDRYRTNYGHHAPSSEIATASHQPYDAHMLNSMSIPSQSSSSSTSYASGFDLTQSSVSREAVTRRTTYMSKNTPNNDDSYMMTSDNRFADETFDHLSEDFDWNEKELEIIQQIGDAKEAKISEDDNEITVNCTTSSKTSASSGIVKTNKPRSLVKKKESETVHPLTDHTYVDFSLVYDDDVTSGKPILGNPLLEVLDDLIKTKSLVKSKHSDKTSRPVRNFPRILAEILSYSDIEDIVSWCPHGRSFKVKNEDLFFERVWIKFSESKTKSNFYRQLSFWSFKRITQGVDKGSYYHECFLRGKPALICKITCEKSKGIGHRTLPNPATEPNFYALAERRPLPTIPSKNLFEMRPV